MTETMSVIVEVWPLAADNLEIWLLSGNHPWETDPIPADSEPHFELEMLLNQTMGEERNPSLLHSTSWRVDGPHVILTYVAVYQGQSDYVRGEWPLAMPITSKTYETVGLPTPHAANEPPVPRYWDVLLHAVRHLRFLKDTDQSARTAMSSEMLSKLATWKPALSGLYGEYSA